MDVVINSQGNIVENRRGSMYAGQSNSKVIKLLDDPENPIMSTIPIARLKVEINITRPDGEQSGWQLMDSIEENIYFYKMQKWDTFVAGDFEVSFRITDTLTDDELVTQAAAGVINKGVIAQTSPMDSEQINNTVNMVASFSLTTTRHLNVNIIESYPISYQPDGFKAPDIIYDNFIATLPDNTTATGSNLVTSVKENVDENTSIITQTEMLQADGVTYNRKIIIDGLTLTTISVGDWGAAVYENSISLLQPKLTAGANIFINSNNVISVSKQLYDIAQGPGLNASLLMSQSAITVADNLEKFRAMGAENNLGKRISAVEGLGGYLTHHNFGTSDPTQEDLTNYALEQIGITEPLDIFNNTRVENDFDGQTWALTNTPNTNPAVFEWTARSGGGAEVAQATNDGTLGIITGDAVTEGNAKVNNDGTLSVNGWENTVRDVSDDTIIKDPETSNINVNTEVIATKDDISLLQPKLTAGTNITIVDNVISASGGGGGGSGGTITFSKMQYIDNSNPDFENSVKYLIMLENNLAIRMDLRISLLIIAASETSLSITLNNEWAQISVDPFPITLYDMSSMTTILGSLSIKSGSINIESPTPLTIGNPYVVYETTFYI